MNLYLNINSYEKEKILFHKPIKNKIANYQTFYKISYNENGFNLNYLLLLVNIEKYNIIREGYKYKLIISENDLFYSHIKELDEFIKKMFSTIIINKEYISCCSELLKKKYLYVFDSTPNLKHLSIKFSGIWETNKTFGLTYKIYYQPSIVNLSNITC
jgi:hypothetical protein